ncbi:glucans biosynthesis glucosyltransferase MdoH [Aquabacter spiritensis]|uniref:Glucans biosynthesis glucosyltransferase H n=1 Tax=Aquabacter spiritensis TaxID=933073 RepID=A0A4R3M2Y5_9HYPH|nr:glucans biosynthesis glucosyltransferase MdoH [Aquabacter spiritensis]TCT07520.1 membrane glycosyltransferase [Aquabacter spiritensis]
MTLRIDPVALAPDEPRDPFTVPGPLRWRRRLVLGLVLATVASVALCAGLIAAAGGWTLPGILLMLCVVAVTPWNAIGFWNAAIGLALLHLFPRALQRAVPVLAAPETDGPILLRTAILMTLRNEDPARALSRLRAVKAALDATPAADRFDYFVLSDTSCPDVAAQEEAAIARWQAQDGARRIHYRRRADNIGFKAGNVRDFCKRWGAGYDVMLPLDADSLMGPAMILRMVRILQNAPQIGILQSLVVGLPSASAFARIFQFGMRAGMRCYTVGATWWAGDCGPFWGHNALIRIAPFAAHCDLPVLPGRPPLGGPILSHDQVEAVLMRRAGYEVWALPVEGESFEENPPTLPDFLARDARWCLGNLQYLKLIGRPGLHPMGRFQLAWAVLMFATVPGVPLALLLLPFAAPAMPAAAALPAAALYLAILLLGLFPKIAGYLDVALTPGLMRRYGGGTRFAASAAIEIGFSFLLGAISALATCGVLLRLLTGRARGSWGGQARDAHRVSWRAAARGLAPTMAYGCAVAGLLLAFAPGLLIWVAPLLAGCWLAIPFAVLTADPRLGAVMARRRLCATPEEGDPPAILAALSGPVDPVRYAA